jgi:hypothetical protein
MTSTSSPAEYVVAYLADMCPSGIAPLEEHAPPDPRLIVVRLVLVVEQIVVVVAPHRIADPPFAIRLTPPDTAGTKLGAELEGREHALARLHEARVTTDDSMAAEWEQLVRRPWLP